MDHHKIVSNNITNPPSVPSQIPIHRSPDVGLQVIKELRTVKVLPSCLVSPRAQGQHANMCFHAYAAAEPPDNRVPALVDLWRRDKLAGTCLLSHRGSIALCRPAFLIVLCISPCCVVGSHERSRENIEGNYLQLLISKKSFHVNVVTHNVLSGWNPAPVCRRLLSGGSDHGQIRPVA